MSAGVEIDSSRPSPANACPSFAGNITLDFDVYTINFAQALAFSFGEYFGGAFNGWQFAAIDFGDFGIPDVSIESSGFQIDLAFRLSFTSTSIDLNLSGPRVSQFNSWTMTLESAPPVPLPASSLLLLGGLAGLAALRRRR